MTNSKKHIQEWKEFRKCQELNPNLRAGEEDEIEKARQSRLFADFYKKK